MSADQADFPIRMMARALGVSKAGYYAWASRQPSARRMADAALLKRIRTVHLASHETYGAPRRPARAGRAAFPQTHCPADARGRPRRGQPSARWPHHDAAGPGGASGSRSPRPQLRRRNALVRQRAPSAASAVPPAGRSASCNAGTSGRSRWPDRPDAR